jgi:hypothetical protein
MAPVVAAPRTQPERGHSAMIVALTVAGMTVERWYSLIMKPALWWGWLQCWLLAGGPPRMRSVGQMREDCAAV